MYAYIFKSSSTVYCVYMKIKCFFKAKNLKLKIIPSKENANVVLYLHYNIYQKRTALIKNKVPKNMLALTSVVGNG